MKKIFSKLKTEAKFAGAGQGHKLTEDTRNHPSTSQRPTSSAPVRTQPMSSTQAQAGSAALARFEKTSGAQKTVVPKVIRQPRSRDEAGSSQDQVEQQKSAPAKSHVEDSVRFHSPFTTEVFSRGDMMAHVHQYLLQNLGANGIESSILMMKMLNGNPLQVQAAIDTINKYIGNVLAHPDEEKYRKIRQNNRIFNERVAPVKGSEEFLEACGFKRTLDGTEEIYFVLELVDIELLKSHQERLSNLQPPEFKLFRDAQVLIPNADSTYQDLPKSFFSLSSDEVKREQLARSHNLEVSRQLRTKAMREAGKTTYNFHYSMIRVKFPDGRILQGTFAADETVGDLLTFVRNNINVEWAVFALKTATGETVQDEKLTLQEAKLVPTIVLNLIWNEEVFSEVQQQQGITLALKDKTS